MVTRTVRHEEILTATENDVLRDTPLRAAPGNGAIAIWMSSDQIDGVVHMRVAGVAYASRTLVPQRPNNQINENDDAPIGMAPVRNGDLIEIDYTEVTAANVRILALFMGA